MRVGHSGSRSARRLQGPAAAASPPSSRPGRSRERGRRPAVTAVRRHLRPPPAEPPARPSCACPPAHRIPGHGDRRDSGRGPTINGKSLGDLDFFWRSGPNRGNLGEDASARGGGRRSVWWGGGRKTEGQRNRGIARRRARSGNCMERQRGTARGAAQAAGRPRHPRDARQPGDLPRRARRRGLGAGPARQRRGRHLHLRGRASPHHRAHQVGPRTGPGAGLLRGRIRPAPGAGPARRRGLRAASGPGPAAAQER